MMRSRSILFSLFLGVFLSACSSTWDVESVKKMEAKGSLFDRALKHEYTELAAKERAGGDWQDTDTFLARARFVATDDRTLLPETMDMRNISEERIPDLRSARIRLMRALENNARLKNPEAAAWAQSGFECWMEEAEEGHQEDQVAACRENFDSAMRILETRDTEIAADDTKMESTLEREGVAADDTKMEGMNANEFVVYFAFAKYNLREEARRILNDTVQAYKNARPDTVTVNGHADRVGSEEFNMWLSGKRAQAAADVLENYGIPSGKIRIRRFGESKPAVPTPDEVREPRNRRAVIEFGEG